MSLSEPRCWSRRCAWFSGVEQPNGEETSERLVCPAYPQGIPSTIAYGEDKHLTVREDQTGDYVYTKKETIQ